MMHWEIIALCGMAEGLLFVQLTQFVTESQCCKEIFLFLWAIMKMPNDKIVQVQHKLFCNEVHSYFFVYATTST